MKDEGGMTAVRNGAYWQLRLMPGEEILATLADFVRRKRIKSAREVGTLPNFLRIRRESGACNRIGRTPRHCRFQGRSRRSRDTSQFPAYQARIRSL
jgi:hypothetical protein